MVQSKSPFCTECCGHKHCGSRNSMVSIYYVISQDQLHAFRVTQLKEGLTSIIK